MVYRQGLVQLTVENGCSAVNCVVQFSQELRKNPTNKKVLTMIHIIQTTRALLNAFAESGHESKAGTIYHELSTKLNFASDFSDEYYSALSAAFLGEINNYNESSLERVASIDTDDLEKAFSLAQAVDQPWVDNATSLNVPAKFFVQSEHGCYGAKSASVGDFFVKGNEVYVVMGHGFKQLRDCTMTRLIVAMAQDA